jgi:hypothetical protein
VAAGARGVDVAFVRKALEYLLDKTDEIHVDIINAHLQYVVPFLRQHGEFTLQTSSENILFHVISLGCTEVMLHRSPFVCTRRCVVSTRVPSQQDGRGSRERDSRTTCSTSCPSCASTVSLLQCERVMCTRQTRCTYHLQYVVPLMRQHGEFTV